MIIIYSLFITLTFII